MRENRTIVFVGGGTGGHLQPGVALGRELHERHPGWRLLFLVSGRGVERSFLSAGQNVLELFPGAASRPSLRRVDQYFRALRSVRRLLREAAPDLLVYMGGYVTGLTALVARGVPAILLEPDRRPGKAARLARRRVSQVFAQWPEERPVRGWFERPGAPRTVTGMPVAWQAVPPREEARRRLGLAPSGRTLLVLGGSQGAQAINRRLAAGAGSLARVPGLQVIHLSGPRDREWLEETYVRAGVTARVLAFSADMDLLYAASDLVVARAGGMTVTELVAVGRAAVLVPYPHHRDLHQEANARMVVDAGGGWIVREGDRGEDFVEAEVIPRLLDEGELRACEARVRALERGDACRAIADSIEKLVGAGTPALG
jgi:UDP-N-acetylglucosamine--N-acetylmuramyl-(pentapeptide) pyrophosphoryl-undecaprenol N-acetylglucosamine transferase